MEKLKEYKWPIITIFLTIIILIFMLSIGYTFGFLSENPDGLEKVIEDAGYVEQEGLWVPILSWVENNYLEGIIGIVIITLIVNIFFYFGIKSKKNK
ncbi:MAG: hypothetical protein KGD63_12675 [Candidatus Lokiarchaeota archaeon]|nr:hypothetical protein [Candidatus Lokiarchaeota archaeon]